MNLSERYKKAKKGVLVGIFGNLFIGLLQLIAGIFGNSLAVIADSMHSISDTLTSVVVWIGLRVGKKQPDKLHPYGHGDAEPIAGLFVAMILGIISFEIIEESINSIINGVTHTPNIITAVVILFSIFFKYWMSGYVFKIADETNSVALASDAAHHKSDYLSSIAVLIGIIGANLGFAILDPIAGIVVAVWIIKIGIEIGKKNIRSLMGESPSKEVLSKIKKITSDVKGIKGVHEIKVHYSGPYAFVSMHINVDKKMKFSEVHDITTKVENEIKKKIDFISNVVVHPEPS
ncbi:MAG: cation transporter [Candidatus Aenigmarchaeota archaeon]|nr:cation transporter [Candidatus Aenigmarchaeota archaeon]